MADGVLIIGLVGYLVVVGAAVLAVTVIWQLWLWRYNTQGGLDLGKGTVSIVLWWVVTVHKEVRRGLAHTGCQDLDDPKVDRELWKTFFASR